MHVGRRMPGSDPGDPDARMHQGLLLGVFSRFIDSLSDSRNVFTDAFDSVAGRSGGGEKEGKSRERGFHVVSPCPSATVADRLANAAFETRFPLVTYRNRSSRGALMSGA